eukprot:m.67102 g.67102  ORF g.67102 m.67102 type:complete len:191 (-) comp8203_c1_seq2:1464-2036(-)
MNRGLEEEADVKKAIKDIYQLYTKLVTAIKPQNEHTNRLHGDLSSEMEGYSLEVTASALILQIEKLLFLCNTLEDILLIEDVEMVNKLRQRQKMELEKSTKALSQRLEGRNATLEEAIDSFITDSYGDPLADLATATVTSSPTLTPALASSTLKVSNYQNDKEPNSNSTTTTTMPTNSTSTIVSTAEGES